MIPQEAVELRQFLLGLGKELGAECVLIGGWAVQAYTRASYSLDGDVMVSYAGQGTLRDYYELTKNPRMRKEQFIAPTGHDIDVYVERQHGLQVPFDELQAHSHLIEGIRVACPEHLLVLKLRAAVDRAHSAKGLKDRQDIATLLTSDSSHWKYPDLMSSYFVSEDWTKLKELATEREALQRLTDGNDWETKDLSKRISHRLGLLAIPLGLSVVPDPGLAHSSPGVVPSHAQQRGVR